MGGGILSDEVVENIICQLVADAGNGGIRGEDIEAIVGWIEETELNHILVELFREGKLSITWGEGEPVFRTKEAGA